MALSAASFAVLNAPAHWRSVDFISDLHLQASEPATFTLWQRYMTTTAADAVFILGDLFEVWVGDDTVARQAFLQDCAGILKQSAAHTHVAFMHGNRDFLVGPDFLQSCQVNALQDPTVLCFAGRRWLLTHGDEGCLADIDYQIFRRKVRTSQWQTEFLAKRVSEREDTGRQLRKESQLHKKNAQSVDVDVDAPWACEWLTRTQSSCLVHGHTHRPQDQVLGPGLSRKVLSDWDGAAAQPRAEVLRWHANGHAERINCA
ncbi:MAG: UDP-2,3-diacylglucosamine diphosphatase [Burkholderiales bacterium]|jgi:UDP-2,3-diacylglucosamine hydrolase|nr:UDP-2,3-diacylglucosamine diphosphatase [Burkholderiales bacterium]